ncbi:hypothetical protein C1T15_28125, partial [Escherichia coli]
LQPALTRKAQQVLRHRLAAHDDTSAMPQRIGHAAQMPPDRMGAAKLLVGDRDQAMDQIHRPQPVPPDPARVRRQVEIGVADVDIG